MPVPDGISDLAKNGDTQRLSQGQGSYHRSRNDKWRLRRGIEARGPKGQITIQKRFGPDATRVIVEDAGRDRHRGGHTCGAMV